MMTITTSVTSTGAQWIATPDADTTVLQQLLHQTATTQKGPYGVTEKERTAARTDQRPSAHTTLTDAADSLNAKTNIQTPIPAKLPNAKTAPTVTHPFARTATVKGRHYQRGSTSRGLPTRNMQTLTKMYATTTTTTDARHAETHAVPKGFQAQTRTIEHSLLSPTAKTSQKDFASSLQRIANLADMAMIVEQTESKTPSMKRNWIFLISSDQHVPKKETDSHAHQGTAHGFGNKEFMDVTIDMNTSPKTEISLEGVNRHDQQDHVHHTHEEQRTDDSSQKMTLRYGEPCYSWLAERRAYQRDHQRLRDYLSQHRLHHSPQQ